ncbi:phosphate ABC transporter permease subunit PstC [Endozoicomonas sp. SCSIO W0465]|uniref:phosphate ABC transporter permease subunit PstC n=1 Tax=Endozoicomonas sp. SCSIO W0465 TaxID=2918516 RepID=UPI002076664E|nr:phosphate ABC transporter permease subunit PstC [Endozoicomonas sp. SCSIO W0465]USE34001.1 phosphate ABC transporter permease subunit PstC [Endozoicomonas sp. SCSIO W0465]
MHSTTSALTLRPGAINGDSIFHRLSFASAVLIFLVLIGIILSLIDGGWQALAKFGPGFIFSNTWDPVGGEFGAAAAIYGTLVSSLIAIVIAIPVGLGTAIFLAELAPDWISKPVGMAIELLAAVPSIIYGMWGLFVFAPWFSEGFQFWALENLVNIPLIGPWFDGPPIGIGLLTAGIILSFMILPIITALTRDALKTVPNVVREAAYGIGATPYEVITRVLLPTIKNAAVGAGILGLGRALGETMAVAFVIGGANRIETSLFMPASSISSTIAQQFNEATNEMHIASLISLGLVLFILTFVVMGAARILLRKR